MKAYHHPVVTSGCGIIGSVGMDIEPPVFASMLAGLSHRGPDGEGVWRSEESKIILGHRRLAIVGLNESGTQPMVRDCIVITCNGEIYNYFELRKELEADGYHFKSNCDTEVIIHAYKKWGISCLTKLDGIFAFALYDQDQRTLLLARDPMGVKPLYYTTIGNGFLFASETEVILKHPSFKRKPNLDAIRGSLILNLLASQESTWYKDVFPLEPGHALLFSNDAVTPRKIKFWTPPETLAHVNYGEACERIRQTLIDDVKLQRLSDVGYAVTLSGGIDSAAVATILSRESDKPLQAFTIRYEEGKPGTPDFEDLQHAKLLADRNDNMELCTVNLSAAQLMSEEMLDKFTSSFDGTIPIDYRTLGMMGLYEYIHKQGVKVILTGQGADEMWMGYYDHPMYSFWNLPPEALTPEAFASNFFIPRIPGGLAAWNNNFLNPTLATGQVLKDLQGNYPEEFRDSPLKRLSELINRTHLRALLNVDDKISMMYSVESRVPWLGLDMLKLAFRFSQEFKIQNGDLQKARSKELVRNALKDILPTEILDRKKMSFPVPTHAYPLALQSIMRQQQSLWENSSFLLEIFTPAYLKSLTQNPVTHGMDLLMVYVLWKFGEKL